MKKAMREKELADAIMAYLTEHPDAADTLEGIAEWWLMRQRVRVEVDSLQNALDQLTETGYLEASGESDNPRYRLRGRPN